MAFILHKGKPYHLGGNRAYPCSISADSIKIDLKNPLKNKITVSCIYTENEIKHRLGIKFIDTWDEEKQKVVKKTNKTVSSIESVEN